MVSIMPGIEALAPDRTDTKRGLSLFPKVFPVMVLSVRMDSMTSTLSLSGSVCASS